MKDPRFQERFSRFINSQFNTDAGATPAEDASYYLTKYVLDQRQAVVGDVRRPVRRRAVERAAAELRRPRSPTNPNGLGYFHSRAWMVRYAGNESAGIRIVSAYRMMQNTIGLKLAATTNAPDVDITANGRMAAQCAGCHYNPWFALDKVATVFGKRTRNGQRHVSSHPPTADRRPSSAA